MQKFKDWQDREYLVEVAFVRFLGGYVAWVDDEPYLEGEPFPTRRAAFREIERHLS